MNNTTCLCNVEQKRRAKITRNCQKPCYDRIPQVTYGELISVLEALQTVTISYTKKPASDKILMPEEMDVFELKSRPMVKSKMREWYDWLIIAMRDICKGAR